MPAHYATQPAWRFRRIAISKKQWFDSNLLMDDAEPFETKHQAAAQSPNLIAVSFDALLMEPEMKPIVLPGAWTVVGKGGKPVKNVKMYDDPQHPKKKKNKKKTRADDEEVNEEAERLMNIAEEPSSSKCVAKHARLVLQHEKVAQSGLDARRWKSYRANKEVKKFMSDELIRCMLHLEPTDGESEVADGDATAQTASRGPLPKAMTQRGCKADSRAAKARRRARLDARDAKCFSLEQEVGEDPATEEATARPSHGARTRPKIDGEAVLLATPSCLLTPRPAEDGWTADPKAKRKKSNQPTKQQQQQQDTSPEQVGGRGKRSSKSSKRSGKGCSVM